MFNAAIYALFGTVMGIAYSGFNATQQRVRDERLFGKVEEQRQEIAALRAEVAQLRNRP